MTTYDFIYICICGLLVTTYDYFVVVNEPTSDSEFYLYLCVIDIYLYELTVMLIVNYV